MCFSADYISVCMSIFSDINNTISRRSPIGSVPDNDHKTYLILISLSVSYQSSSSRSRLLFLFFLISIQVKAMTKPNKKTTGIPIPRPSISERLSVRRGKRRVIIQIKIYLQVNFIFSDFSFFLFKLKVYLPSLTTGLKKDKTYC